MIRILGFLFLLLVTRSASAEPVQWTVADGGNGHWYEVVVSDELRCWPEARDAAYAMRGRLGSLETIEEFDFVTPIIYADLENYQQNCMVGLFQDEGASEPGGGWRWLTGEPLTYDRWDQTLDDNWECQDYAALGGGGFDDIYPCGEAGCEYSSYSPSMLVEWATNPALLTDGDYNGDGVVDAVDYTVWRDTMGQTVTLGTGADGDADGFIGLHDYGVWKDNFGNGVSATASSNTRVPEPTTLLLVLMTLLGTPLRRAVCHSR